MPSGKLRWSTQMTCLVWLSCNLALRRSVRKVLVALRGVEGKWVIVKVHEGGHSHR